MARWSWWGYRPTESPKHGPPSETPSTQRPATGGSGYGAGHAPDGLKPPPKRVTRTKITKEGLLHLVVARDGLPMNDLGDQWAVAVSEILLDLLERGVELEVPAQPDVPYQQYN